MGRNDRLREPLRRAPPVGLGMIGPSEPEERRAELVKAAAEAAARAIGAPSPANDNPALMSPALALRLRGATRIPRRLRPSPALAEALPGQSARRT
jgi:hypothetical protein